jgi:hypothetical protein
LNLLMRNALANGNPLLKPLLKRAAERHIGESRLYIDCY